MADPDTTDEPRRLPTALVADELSKRHDTGAEHPESPARFDAVMQMLKQSDFTESLLHLLPRAATDGDLLRCHQQNYLELVEREIAAGRNVLSTGDTTVCEDSLEPALHAAGGACVAIDAVVGGKAKNAFCVHRPPGHHATPEKAMGFCIYGNAAIAARYAQAKHGIEKVLIVDWDVHHGNGTQDIFYEDPTVFFFSTHQSPWYPGTGAKDETGRGKGLGTTMNHPFPAGSGRKEIFAVFQDDLVPKMSRFKPDLVIISAGFDSRIDDPLGQFRLTDEDFADLTGIVLSIADDHAESRVISVLEGGYNLDGLASASAAHCGRLVKG